MSEPGWWAVLSGSTSRTSSGFGPAPVRTRWDPGRSAPSLAGRPAARRRPAAMPVPPPGSLVAGRSLPAPSGPGRPVRGLARLMPFANQSRNGPRGRADAARETAPRTALIVRRTSPSSARSRSPLPARADAARETAPRTTPIVRRMSSSSARPRSRPPARANPARDTALRTTPIVRRTSSSSARPRSRPPARADPDRETAPRTTPIVRRTSPSSARPRSRPPARADPARETVPRTTPIVRRTSSSSARPRSRLPARADAGHGTAPRRDRTPHRKRASSAGALPLRRDGGLRFVPARCGNPCSPAASDSPSGAPSAGRSAPAVRSSHPPEGSSPRACVPDPFLAPRSPAGKRSAGRTSRIGSSGGRSSMLFKPKSSRNLRVTP